MDRHCSKCNARLSESQLSEPGARCPQCGGEVISNGAAPVPAPVKKTARGAFTGLLFGLVLLPIFLIPGIMLCLTGLGVLLGIPMILIAILAPIAGPLVGMSATKGRCPKCGTLVGNLKPCGPGACPVCCASFDLDARIPKRA